MKRKKSLFIAGLLLCLVLATVAVFLYQKPRKTAADSSTDQAITAKELYSAFVQNEQTASQRYNNKVLEVKGTVLQTQQTGQSFSLLLFGGSSDGAGVNCSITAAYKGKAPVTGQSVKVKGICTGFLVDVNLTDAVLIVN